MNDAKFQRLMPAHTKRSGRSRSVDAVKDGVTQRARDGWLVTHSAAVIDQGGRASAAVSPDADVGDRRSPGPWAGSGAGHVQGASPLAKRVSKGQKFAGEARFTGHWLPSAPAGPGVHRC